MSSRSLLRSAWQLATLRFLLRQIGLAVIAFALFAAWLRVPDGTVLSVIGSVVLAVFALCIIFGGEAWLLLRLRSLTSTRSGLIRGAVALLIAGLLLFPLSTLLNHLSVSDGLRAGYLNSRFPASMRNLFSYPHLLALFEETWDSLFWAGAIVLVMAAVAITVASKPLAAWKRMLRSLTAWVVLSAATIVGSEATAMMMAWTPGHGLSVETFSLVFRLSVTILLDALLLCLSLALLAVLAEESDAHHLPAAIAVGTPDLSQPRTEDKP